MIDEDDEATEQVIITHTRVPYKMRGVAHSSIYRQIFDKLRTKLATVQYYTNCKALGTQRDASLR